MLKGTLRKLLLSLIFLLPCSSLVAGTEHFWLLHESGIEKRSMEDGSLLEQVVQLYKPITFTVDETNQKIWTVSDGYISSFDLEGNMLASSELENINQGARLIANSEDGGAWLSHKGEIYHYDEDAQRLATTELKLPGNQINDITLDATDNTLWLTSGNQVISISSNGDVSQHELAKEETATGIVITEAQDVAVTIATPQPELRLYNKDFELQSKFPLPQEATNPVRIAASGENIFWITAKQSVVLVDSGSGVVTSHPITGELGLGPGEIDVISNEGDGGAWVSVGRSLLHINAEGEVLRQSEILYKTLEIESNSESVTKDTTPPMISFPFHDSFWVSRYGGSKYTYPVPFGYKSTLHISAYDAESDVDIQSLKIWIDGHETNKIVEVGYSILNTPHTAYETHCGILHTDLEPYTTYDGRTLNKTKFFLCDFSREIIHNLDEGRHTFSTSATDNAGNTSPIYSVDVIIDKTPPAPVNIDLVEVVDSSDGNLTIIGHPGAVEGADEPADSWSQYIYNYATGRYAGYKQWSLNEDGSFSLTIPGKYGDLIGFFNYDYAHNYSYSYLSTRVYIDIAITSPLNYSTIDGGPTTVSGTHDSYPNATISVNGVPATINGNTFTAHDVPVADDGVIIADVSAPDGAHGTVSIKIYIDSTPPNAPNPDNISVQYISNNTARINGQNYSVEANSTVTVTNTATDATSTTQADDFGRFTVDIAASHGNTLSITATDKAGNVSQSTLIDAGYIIDLQASQPTPGTTVYSQKVLVAGFHSGPANTVITVNGDIASINGNQFSREIEINPNTGAIEIIATGPNSGYGKTSFSVVYKVPAPNTGLIDLTFNSDETITVLGKPGSGIADGVVTIHNTSRGTSKSAYIATDGSFVTTIDAVGGDTLTLIAKDKNGIEGDAVTINAGYVADIAITSPLDGSEVGPAITVTGSHSGPADSIVTVNGVDATITGSTYTANNIPASSGTITAKLFSTDGAYGITSINVTLDITPPAIPNLDLIDTAFSAGNSVYLNGKTGSVEANATLTITNTSQNVSKSVTVVDDGSFSAYIPGLPGETLSLAATDAVGNQSEAATLTLGSEAMITINTPYEGAIIPALIANNGGLTGLVNVTGSHNGPVNSGIVVNGVVAAVSADQFVALNVPVAADGIITAKLTALDGSHGTAQLTVGLNDQPYLLSLAPSSIEGMAPHSVNFDWNAYTAEPPTEVSIDYDGDGTFDQSSSNLTTPLQHDYTTAGINNVTLRITMADDSYHTAETVVVTHGSDHYDAVFLSLWNGMNDALLANEPLLALNYLERRAQGQYFNTFRVIAPRMQSIVDSYRTPARSSVDDYYLEYIVPRASENGSLLYYIYCVRESDGSWRIKEM